MTQTSQKRYKLDGKLLTELRMLGWELPTGTSSAGELCPFCRGGRSGERSFSITRVETDKIGYYCHRATCGAHGFLGGTFGPGVEARKPHREEFSNQTKGLGEWWLRNLATRFGIPGDHASRLGWLEEIDSGRLVVYVRDAYGKVRGVHTRSRGGNGLKTRDYRQDSECWMAWFRPESEDMEGPIVLVEDVISAAKVCYAGFATVSLMGSSFTLDHLAESLAVAKGRKLIIALDRDATDKSIQFALEYNFLSGGTLVPLLLSKDLKYHSKEEIAAMVNSVCGD